MARSSRFARLMFFALGGNLFTGYSKGGTYLDSRKLQPKVFAFVMRFPSRSFSVLIIFVPCRFISSVVFSTLILSTIILGSCRFDFVHLAKSHVYRNRINNLTLTTLSVQLVFALERSWTLTPSCTWCFTVTEGSLGEFICRLMDLSLSQTSSTKCLSTLRTLAM